MKAAFNNINKMEEKVKEMHSKLHMSMAELKYLIEANNAIISAKRILKFS